MERNLISEVTRPATNAANQLTNICKNNKPYSRRPGKRPPKKGRTIYSQQQQKLNRKQTNKGMTSDAKKRKKKEAGVI